MDKDQQRNREKWQLQAEWYEVPAEQNWSIDEPRWGIWGIQDKALNLLPQEMVGLSCLEIGCGAAYVSAWMAKRGARVVGIDPTPNQLATAIRLEERYQTGINLVEGFGESLPFKAESFDFAISEYGAALWADPYHWLPEASRVLRPTGTLIFMTDHLFAFVTANEDETLGQSKKLQRSFFDSYRMIWSEEDGVEFHLTHSAWIDLFKENNLIVERLLELGAPEDAQSRYEFADPQWAEQWPSEEVWVLRKQR